MPNSCAHVADYWQYIYNFSYWRGCRLHILEFCFGRTEYYLKISK